MLGISTDTMESHEKFAIKYSLPFPLVSDIDAAACTAYGVYKEKNMYGRKYMGIERTTFVIDQEGRIAASFLKVKVDGHAQKVLEKVSQLV